MINVSERILEIDLVGDAADVDAVAKYDGNTRSGCRANLRESLAAEVGSDVVRAYDRLIGTAFPTWGRPGCGIANDAPKIVAMVRDLQVVLDYLQD